MVGGACRAWGCVATLVLAILHVGLWSPRAYSFEEGNAMLRRVVEQQVGVVPAQVLDYAFVAIPPDRRSRGQVLALRSFGDWLATIFNAASLPTADATPGFHVGDDETCDAVMVDYLVDTGADSVRLRVFQTLFLIAIIAAPAHWPADWTNDRRDAALRVARRLFQRPETIDLRMLGTDQGVAFGEQVLAPERAAEARDWRDTIKWWSADRAVGYVLLKSTGGGQAARLSHGLQPNRKWFDMFEKPRYR